MIILLLLLLINPIISQNQSLNCEVMVDQIKKGNFKFNLSCQQTPLACSSIYQEFTITHANSNYLELQGQMPLNSWKSEVNDQHTRFGAIGQKRNIENGLVESKYVIFLKRQEFDGPQSQWLVIGEIKDENDKRLLQYLQWTLVSDIKQPRRNAQFTCK